MLMANMSYCRFQNTVADMMDCIRAMEDDPKTFDRLDPGYQEPDIDEDSEEFDDDELMDDSEIRAMRDFVTLCEDVVRGFSSDYELESIETSAY